MHLARIDEVERPGAGVLAHAADTRDLAADLDRSDRESIVRVRREFMGDERGAQAFHVAEARIPPEAGLLLP